MASIENIPAKTRQKVLRFISEDLGVEPQDVANIVIVPREVSVEVMLRDEDGEFYLTSEGLPASTTLLYPMW